MTKEREGFHITITNNKTGETLHDADVCAIIGAFNDGARTGCVCLTSCDAFDIAHTIDGVEDVIQNVYNDHPEIRLFVEMLAKMTQENEEDK